MPTLLDQGPHVWYSHSTQSSCPFRKHQSGPCVREKVRCSSLEHRFESLHGHGAPSFLSPQFLCWTAALRACESFSSLSQSQPPWEARPFVLIKGDSAWPREATAHLSCLSSEWLWQGSHIKVILMAGLQRQPCGFWRAPDNS